MASILHLSNEILHMIIEELTWKCHEALPPEMFSLRQSCPRLCDFTTPLIFSTLHVMVDERCLQNMVKISETPHLVQQVQKLNIHTLHLLPYNDSRRLEPSFDLGKKRYKKRHLPAPKCTSAPSTEFEHNQRLKRQRQLLKNEFAYNCLLEAMSKLSQCKTIEFDGGPLLWTRNRLKETFGVRFHMSIANSKPSYQFVGFLLKMILSAAIKSELRVETLALSIGFQRGSSFCTPLDLLPHLPSPIYSLRHLHILFHDKFKENKLQKFVNFFPNLSSLSLEHEKDNDEELYTLNETDTAYFQDFISGLYIPKLRKLTLNMFDCTATGLRAFIVKHSKTLEDISFIYVDLIDGQLWHEVLHGILMEVKIKCFRLLDK